MFKGANVQIKSLSAFAHFLILHVFHLELSLQFKYQTKVDGIHHKQYSYMSSVKSD